MVATLALTMAASGSPEDRVSVKLSSSSTAASFVMETVITLAKAGGAEFPLANTTVSVCTAT